MHVGTHQTPRLWSSGIRGGIARHRTILFLLALLITPPSLLHGQRPIRISASGASLTIPDEWKAPCEIPRRDDLQITTLHRNPEVYPTFAARTETGWLVYDEYEEQVIELDDALAEVARWGRNGPGPMEYQSPIAVGRTASGRTVVVDSYPPSLILLGEGGNDEFRIALNSPLSRTSMRADVLADRVLISPGNGSIREIRFDNPRGSRSLWHVSDDLGFTIRDGVGEMPELFFRSGPGDQLYTGFEMSSRVWRLGDPDATTEVLQRCVPDALATSPERPPRVSTRGLPLVAGLARAAPFIIRSFSDFAPLPGGGFLTLGRLRIRDRDNDIRGVSLELHDADGQRTQAWILELAGTAFGLFDPRNPRRLLIWNQGEDFPGVSLIEVDAPGYPPS